MLYLIHGDDFKKARSRFNELIDSFVKEKPQISVVKIDQENASEYNLSSFLEGQGLFEKEILVVLDSLFTFDLFSEKVLELIPQIAESKNTFVFLESLLDKKTADLLKKHAQKTEEFFLKKSFQKVFNPFSLGDALGEKNKRLLWVLFYKASQNGMTPEEIFGVLFWQIKTIIIAKEASDFKESGLKEFPYGKAKKFAEKFKTEDLKKISSRLVDIYHESRLGKIDFATGLERFTLTF